VTPQFAPQAAAPPALRPAGRPTARLAAWLRSPVGLVTATAVVLAIVNIAITPGLVTGAHFPATVNLLVPAVLAAMASVPSILSGGGGLDLSVGPLLGFVDVLAVGVLLPAGLGLASIPVCLAIGAATGVVNGVLVAYFRLQPIVVTLGTYLVFAGWSLVVMPQPQGNEPGWAAFLGGAWAGGYVPRSVLPLIAAVALWMALRRLGFVRLVTAIGSDDRAAYTAGVNVAAVRLGAYALGGLIAALAGLTLVALIGSGDPTVGPQYTLEAVAAVALGGNSLAGGQGGMTGPAFGAATLFLIQSLLSSLKVSSMWIQVVYGAVLLVALCLNSSFSARLRAGANGVVSAA
jgi:ribose transport system permease protein